MSSKRYRVYLVNPHFGMPQFQAEFSTRQAAKDYVARMQPGCTGKFKIQVVG